MKIGIIVAMSKELNLLMESIDGIKKEEIGRYKFYIGNIGSNEIYAMQCGIGKVNSAIGTMTLIEKFAPDLIINTGVAGGAGNEVRQMDIVICERIAYHDVWCGPGTDYGEASGFPLYFKSEESIVEMTKKSFAKQSFKYGLICSGDKFVSSQQEIDCIKSHFPDVTAVDMESASIAQVCQMMKVPVFIMRVISDIPGIETDNISQYENFWETAPKHTFIALSEILKHIN